jgi:uncharacterized protein YwgA
VPNDLDKIVACLRFLGLRPKMYVYRWRFLVQKIAFLAKALGMDIGYSFTIYVAGPYSRELNCDYYPDVVKTRIDALQTDYTLSLSDVSVLEKVRNCQGLLESQSLMEATSTAVFFMTQNPNIADDDLFMRLKWFKPHIGESDRVVGITKAKELLFKPEYLTEEIKREMDEWDRLES